MNVDDVDLRTGNALVTGKGNKTRTIFVGRAAVRALQDWLPARTAQLSLVRRERESALFIGSRDGGRLDGRTIGSEVRRAGRRAGLATTVHPHLLRHALATHLADGGVSLTHIAALLGHSSVHSTHIYTRLATKRLEAVIREFHPRG